jgi:hypothetical protein
MPVLIESKYLIIGKLKGKEIRTDFMICNSYPQTVWGQEDYGNP